MWSGASGQVSRQGVEVLAYSDGLSALLALHETAPDVILAPTDLRGVALPDFVRAVVAWTNIPVIVGVTTAPEAPDIAASAIDVGAESLLTLPVDPQNLTFALRNLGFAANGHRSAEVLRVGPYTADPLAFRFAVDDKLVPLAAREFQVMCYMMERPDRVISPLQLARAGSETSAAESASRTIIKRIRAKMEAAVPGSSRVLETVTGQGYRFVRVEG
jgi:DNA-binding response OmpR family regulator